MGLICRGDFAVVPTILSGVDDVGALISHANDCDQALTLGFVPVGGPVVVTMELGGRRLVQSFAKYDKSEVSK